jgi:uncharacterized protein (TIGR03437 family)
MPAPATLAFERLGPPHARGNRRRQQDNSFNSASNPAPRGSILTFYATGVGKTSPCVDGATYTSNFPTLALRVIVGVGSSGAQVVYEGQEPDLVSGVAPFNVVIPSDSATGVVPLTLHLPQEDGSLLGRIPSLGKIR